MEENNTKKLAAVIEDIRHPDAAVEREWASVPIAQAITFGEDPTMARTLKAESTLGGKQIRIPDFDTAIDNLIHDGDATGFIGGTTYKISVGTLPCLYYSDSTGPMKCEWISTVLAVNGDNGQIVFERDVKPDEVESVLRRILIPAPINKPEKKPEPAPAADTTSQPVVQAETATAAKTDEPKSDEGAEAQELVEKIDTPEQEQEQKTSSEPVVHITLLDRSEKRGKSRRALALQKLKAEEEKRRQEAEQRREGDAETPLDVAEEREPC